ncbi:hypothetical protein BB561_004622 [Smittium simulii]|uniref:Aminoglycoside phosphotransferase domain-containing protein n=1 Tax=Smittium simulii TaxID=133385 RepID=A0A2T9YFE4_9FUNG|nr:hypothetical protein BB561_004622 [Smittium simulii]
MSQQTAVNEQVLGEYLATKLNLTLPIQCEKFSHGQSNPTFLVIDSSSPAQKFVVRKKPSGALISKTAHAVEREYRIIKALGQTPVPVPKVFDLCTDNSILGTPFYVMEYLDGRIFKDPMLPELADNRTREQYYMEMVRVMAALHNVDYRKVGLDGYGKHGGYYSRQAKSLTKVHKLQAETIAKSTGGATDGTLPRFNELVDWLLANPCPDDITIAHGDYKLDNVVFHKTEPRIIGVLDWELSTIGNPRADLANMLQYMALGPLDASSPATYNPNITIPSESMIIRRYCNLTHRSYPLQGMVYAKAFSLLRNAVIAHGIKARLSIGQASSSAAALAADNGPERISEALNVIYSSHPQSKL